MRSWKRGWRTGWASDHEIIFRNTYITPRKFKKLATKLLALHNYCCYYISIYMANCFFQGRYFTTSFRDRKQWLKEVLLNTRVIHGNIIYT